MTTSAVQWNLQRILIVWAVVLVAGFGFVAWIASGTPEPPAIAAVEPPRTDYGEGLRWLAGGLSHDDYVFTETGEPIAGQLAWVYRKHRAHHPDRPHLTWVISCPPLSSPSALCIERSVEDAWPEFLDEWSRLASVAELGRLWRIGSLLISEARFSDERSEFGPIEFNREEDGVECRLFVHHSDSRIVMVFQKSSLKGDG